MKTMKMLMLGDVVGPAAVDSIKAKLWKYRRENNINFVMINGENSAVGNGISFESADELLSAGGDIITTGNHAFKKYEAKKLFEENELVLRPANFPGKVSGNGYKIIEAEGFNILIINLMGVVFMEPLANPFETVDKILSENAGKFDFCFVDIHAEATSEKQALAFYLDGRVSGVFGTHTHTQTADEKIFPMGTAFITDVGMCGPVFSVLGVKPECIIEKMTTHTPVKFELSENEIETNGVFCEFDTETKKAVSIKRVNI